MFLLLHYRSNNAYLYSRYITQVDHCSYSGFEDGFMNSFIQQYELINEYIYRHFHLSTGS